MFAVVLIALTLSLLLVFVVLAVMFLDVAFGPQPVCEDGPIPEEWQPPLIHDDELLAWAANTARDNVRRRLSLPRTETTAKEIAAEIRSGATHAINSSPRKPKRSSEHACSSCRHQMIAVTPPEAIAIVEAVRSKRPQDIRSICGRAIQNAGLAKDMDRQQYEAAQIVCPLLCNGNTCAANGMRPLHCRGWIPLPDSQAPAGSTPGKVSAIDPHAHTVVQGLEDGLAQELSAQGLDGDRYELNSALAAAFDAAGAATSWAKGEAVFANCKRCP